MSCIALLALADVGEERHLARPLDGDRHLVLVAPAGAGDAARADLAPLGDEAAEHVHVLVVDVLDLRAAERAVAAAHLAVALAGTTALRRTLFSLLRLLRHQNGMSSSAAA